MNSIRNAKALRHVLCATALVCAVVAARADLQNAAYRSDATATNQYNASWTAAHAVNEVTGGEGWQLGQRHG